MVLDAGSGEVRRKTMMTGGGSGGGGKWRVEDGMVEPDSPRHCCRLHRGGGKESHQLVGGTLPSWWEIKDGSDTGCQNNNGALTVRCVVLLSVGLLCCVFVSAIFVVSPKPCATVFPPPHPVTSGFSLPV